MLNTAVVMAMTFGDDFPSRKEHDQFVELAKETSNGIARLFFAQEHAYSFAILVTRTFMSTRRIDAKTRSPSERIHECL